MKKFIAISMLTFTAFSAHADDVHIHHDGSHSLSVDVERNKTDITIGTSDTDLSQQTADWQEGNGPDASTINVSLPETVNVEVVPNS
jgi:hypothetical protein